MAKFKRFDPRNKKAGKKNQKYNENNNYGSKNAGKKVKLK